MWGGAVGLARGEYFGVNLEQIYILVATSTRWDWAVAKVLRVPRSLQEALSRLAARKRESETRIITVDELVEILKGPNVIAVPPLMYQLEQMPPKLRAFFEQGSSSGSPVEKPLSKTRRTR